MIIKSVDIKNFLIIGQAKIELHNRGLVRICGDNNDDSTSSSNGSGKSAILEAIYWGLFGDTLRSLKSADSVVNNSVKKNCGVVVELEEEGTSYRVERYRKHSKKKNNLYLYINDVDSRGKDNRETQEYIEEILSIDKVSFANSIVFGQGYSKNLRRFSELSDKEQKECLESILDMEVFATAHTHASKELKDLLAAKEGKLCVGDIISRSLEEEQSNFLELKSSYAAFDSDKTQRIAESRRRYKGVIAEIEDMENQLEIFPEHRSESEISDSIAEYGEELASYNKKREKLKDKYDTSRNKLLVIKNGINKEISTLLLSLEKLSDGSDAGEECLYCGALVAEDRVITKRGDIDFEVIDKRRSIKTLEKKIISLTKCYDAKGVEIDEVVSLIKEVLFNLAEEQQHIFSLKVAQEKLKSKLEYAVARAETYLEHIEHIELEENPYEFLVEKVKSSIKKKKKKIKDIEDAVTALEKEVEYYTFWKEGFSRGGIRSYLLDKIIPFLTERANHYLAILTDGGIQVKFNARKQLANGEWRENFNVEVLNANAADTYEGNSGGEKRRIDLAISLAINDFIASRSGKRFNILLLDEVFENIDETGVYYVVKVLEELAKNRSSVFVITHHDSLASYFSETIKLSRKDGVSYIQ